MLEKYSINKQEITLPLEFHEIYSSVKKKEIKVKKVKKLQPKTKCMSAKNRKLVKLCSRSCPVQDGFQKMIRKHSILNLNN